MYKLLFENKAIFDGKKFFSADHRNHITTGSKPSQASIQQIADRLHVTYQTIWRELRRDGVWYEHTLSNLTTERRYSADIAQAQYEKNKRAKGGMIKLGHDFALHDFIEQKIGREHYSPAAVIMEIKLRGLKFDVDICEKTIYNYINSGDVFFSLSLIHI